jgi:hypothetical protein
MHKAKSFEKHCKACQPKYGLIDGSAIGIAERSESCLLCIGVVFIYFLLH